MRRTALFVVVFSVLFSLHVSGQAPEARRLPPSGRGVTAAELPSPEKPLDLIVQFRESRGAAAMSAGLPADRRERLEMRLEQFRRDLASIRAVRRGLSA